MFGRLSTKRPDETPTSYAIEHGEHLAQSAEWLLNKIDTRFDMPFDDEMNDACSALRRGIYEFRKRAIRAGFPEATTTAQPAGEE